MNDITAVSNGEKRKLLSARVSHVSGDGQKLFEEEKSAKSGASDVAFEREIDGERKRDEKLQEGAAGNINPVAEETEKEVPAFVNGKKNDVEHEQRSAMAIGLVQKEQIKKQPDGDGPARDGLPVVLEGFEEWEAGSECVRKIHECYS